MRAPSPLFIEERQDHKKLTFTAKHHRPTKAEQKQEWIVNIFSIFYLNGMITFNRLDAKQVIISFLMWIRGQHEIISI